MLLLVFKGGGNTSLIIMAFRNWILPVTARLSSVTLMIIAEFILSIFGSPLILLLSPPPPFKHLLWFLSLSQWEDVGWGLGTAEQALSSPGPFQFISFILCLYLELLSRGQRHTSAPIVTVYATTASCGPCKKDEQWRQLECLCS